MPEPTPDLEAIVERINNAHRASEGIYTATAYDEFHRLTFRYWPAIRANLMFGPPSTEEEVAAAQCRVDLEAALLREDYANRRMAELERALGEYGEH